MVKKLISLLILIGIILTPLSGNLKPQEAAALNLKSAIDWDRDGKISGTESALTTAGSFLAVSCSPIGRITGLDKITDKVADAIATAIKNAAKSIAGALGIPTSFGEVPGKLGEELAKSVSGNVPVDVENFKDEAGKKVTAIAEANKITADQTTKESTTSLCNEVNKLFNNLVKQILLEKIRTDILTWIEGGNFLDGKASKRPVIVNNWKEYLKTTADAAIGDLANEVGLGFLCSPIKFQIQVTLRKPPEFKDRVKCSLTQDILKNIENFYQDFRKGGWITYQESWQPENNMFGLALLSVEEAAKREDAAKTAAQNEAVAGGGFLSKKNCITVTLPGGKTTEDCTIRTPGSVVGSAVSETLVNSPLGSVLSQDELGGFVGDIIDALINKITREGINKLKAGF
jgi:hypothetical protein